MRALREAKATQPRSRAEVWDGRWRITGSRPDGAETGALGAAGLAQLPDWRVLGLPRHTLMVSPARFGLVIPLSQPPLPVFSRRPIARFRFIRGLDARTPRYRIEPAKRMSIL